MVSPPLVNNIYHNAPHVVVPQIIQHPGYVLQPNVVCYSSPPIQSTYPQQIFIPSNAVHSFSHTPAYYPITPTQPKLQVSAALPVQPDIQQNGTVHSPPLNNEVVNIQNHPEPIFIDKVSDEVNVNVKENNEHDANIDNLAMPAVEIVNKMDLENSQQNETQTFCDQIPQNAANIPASQGYTNIKGADPNSSPAGPDVIPPSSVSSPVLQNGIGSTPSPAPINKSWASLFNSKTTNSNSSPVPEVKITKELASSEKNNIVPLCPIKHPRKSTQFIDPDCYRMGGKVFL